MLGTICGLCSGGGGGFVVVVVVILVVVVVEQNAEPIKRDACQSAVPGNPSPVRTMLSSLF